MFKVYNNDTRTGIFIVNFKTYFTPCSSAGLGLTVSMMFPGGIEKKSVT